MKESTFTLTSSDGTALHTYHWHGDAPPRAVLQIAHGMGEHAARYRELAEVLVGLGWAVYANDHRGHGRSVNDPADLGHMADRDGFARATDDVYALTERILDDHEEIALFMLGHSMGSFIAQQLICDRPEDYAGIALSASNGKPPAIAAAGRLVARAEVLRGGPRGRSDILAALSFEDFNKKFKPNRTEADWLSRDEAEVDKYVADPLCGFIASNQSWVDFLDALGPLTDPERLARVPKDLPIYCFAGDRDAVGDMGRGVKRLVNSYRGAWLCDVTLKLYPGARHETLHETNRAEVIADLVKWLERKLAASTS